MAPPVHDPDFHVVIQQQVDGNLGIRLSQRTGEFDVARLPKTAHDDDHVEGATR